MGVGDRIASTPRQLLLILLSQIVARKPFAMRKLDNIMSRLQREEGEATAVEAAGHVALIEAYSKVTDSTGRTPIPKVIEFVLPKVIRIRRYFAPRH